MKKSKPSADPVQVLTDAAMEVIGEHGIPDRISVLHGPEGMPTVHIVYEDEPAPSPHVSGGGRGRIYSLSGVKEGGCGYVFEADRKKKKTVH